MSEEKSKTNGKRNRAAGHKLETDTVKKLHEIGYEGLCTSRNNSRLRDSQKIDIMYKDEAKNGRFPFNIQCKNVSKHVEYAKLLAELPTDTGAINVIFHKQTKKSDNGRFMRVGEYAILELDDFYRMMQKQKELEDEIEAYKVLS